VARTICHPWPKADVGHNSARATQTRKRATSTADRAQPAAMPFIGAWVVWTVGMSRSPFRSDQKPALPEPH
jgi:hypothetical protein